MLRFAENNMNFVDIGKRFQRILCHCYRRRHCRDLAVQKRRPPNVNTSCCSPRRLLRCCCGEAGLPEGPLSKPMAPGTDDFLSPTGSISSEMHLSNTRSSQVNYHLSSSFIQLYDVIWSRYPSVRLIIC